MGVTSSDMGSEALTPVCDMCGIATRTEKCRKTYPQLNNNMTLTGRRNNGSIQNWNGS